MTLRRARARRAARLAVAARRASTAPRSRAPCTRRRARAGRTRSSTPRTLERLRGRVAFVRAHLPEAGLPEVGEAELDATLAELCLGRDSFAELREAGLLGALVARLGPQAAGLLAKEAPEQVTLPGGRQVRGAVSAGQAPFIASRLQDFFGLAAGPTLGARTGAADTAPAGAESARGAGHVGSRGLLGAPLPGAATRARAALPAPLLARGSAARRATGAPTSGRRPDRPTMIRSSVHGG